MQVNVHSHRRALMAGASFTVILLSALPALAEDPAATDDAVQVPAVSVTDTAAGKSNQPLNTVTEGSKSYTSNAVTVGDKTATGTKDIANTISVETRQYLDDRNITNIYDAMRLMPGVTAMPNDGVQSQYNARGYGLNGMVDGVPAYNGFNATQQFDLAIYDHLELLHGSAGLLQGSGSPGGTVNMVRKKGTADTQASASLSYGSWNNTRAIGDISAPLNADGSLRSRLVVVGQDRDFYYDHAHQVKRVAYGEIEYDITPNTTAGLSLAIQTNRQSPFYGVPRYTNYTRMDLSPSFNPTAAWSMDDTQTKEENLNLEHRFDNGWVGKVNATWNEQYHRYIDSEQSTGVNINSGLTSYWGPEDYTYRKYHQTVDAYVSGPFDLLGRTHKLLLGANSDRYNYNYAGGSLANVNNVNIFSLPSSVTTQPTIPYDDGAKNNSLQYGPYGQLRLSLLDPLTLVGGGRMTNFSNRSRGANPGTATKWSQGAEANQEFTPYGGVIYDLTKEISAYVSWSDIFIPQTQQTYSGQTLAPRQGEQWETGVKGSFYDNQLNTSLALYDLDDVNRAYADPDHKNYFLSMGEVRTQGVDYEISGKPAPGWELMASYSYMISQYVKDATSTGSTPTNMYPRHLVKTWAKYSFESGELKGLGLGLGVNGMTRYWGNSSGSAGAQSAYGVMDGLIGYDINDNLSLLFNANNITNTKYFATTGRSTGTYNTYGDPRNFLLTVKAKI